MSTFHLLFVLLATQGVVVVLTTTVTAATVVVIVRQSLQSAPDHDRAAILRSVAEITRALCGRRR
ncbi:hypothetical protein [Streptomyces sp. NPDC058613]|uniref:hypothetical protein n=1 Tax=unclassified Streptomyces TaxID=2593676 RepID=UPI00364B1B77